MGKKRRKAEREERRRLRVLPGGGEGGEVPTSSGGQKFVPLEGRPEYEAHMEAWRKHGCPRPQ